MLQPPLQKVPFAGRDEQGRFDPLEMAAPRGPWARVSKLSGRLFDRPESVTYIPGDAETLDPPFGDRADRQLRVRADGFLNGTDEPRGVTIVGKEPCDHRRTDESATALLTLPPHGAWRETFLRLPLCWVCEFLMPE